MKIVQQQQSKPQVNTDPPQIASEILILSLMRLACVSPALITSADSLRIDVSGSRPSSEHSLWTLQWRAEK